MGRWYREANWWLMIVTLFIGALGLISAEYGPLFNKPKIQFFTSENTFEIGHDYGSLFFYIPIDIIKTGRGDKSIFKMQFFLQRHDGKYELLFDWNKSPMTISSNLTTRLDIRFWQEIDIVKYKNFHSFLKPVKEKLLINYKKEGWVQKAYFLDYGDEDVKKLQEFVKDLLTNLIPCKYKGLIVAFEDANDSVPIWSAAYSFEMSDSMINNFIYGQLSSYDSVADFNPKYQNYSVRPIVEKIGEIEKERLFHVYKLYSSKKPNN